MHSCLYLDFFDNIIFIYCNQSSFRCLNIFYCIIYLLFFILAKGRRRRSLVILPAHVIFQAVKACRQYLESQDHLDIEDRYDEHLKMDNLTWDALLANYNQIVQ